MKKFCILLFLLISTNVYSLDLSSAFKAAIISDPEFIGAVKEYEATKSSKIIGFSALLPKLSASYYSATNNSKISGPAYLGGPNIVTNRNYPSDNLLLQLTQPVFDLQALAKYRKSLVDAEYGEAKKSDDTLSLLVRVFKAYSDLIRSIQNETYKRAAYLESVQDLKQKKSNYDKGLVVINDVLEAEASKYIAFAKLESAKEESSVYLQKLSGITGISPNSITQISTLGASDELPAIPKASFEEAVLYSYSNNPYIASKILKATSAREEYNKNRAEYSPTLSLVTSWGQQNSQNTASINQNAVSSLIGLQLNVPIFSGGETNGKSTQSFFLYEKALAEVDVAKNEIKNDLRMYLGKLSSGHHKVLSQLQMIRATQQSLHTAVKLKTIREATDYDYLAAITKHEKSIYDYVDEKLTYLDSWIGYKRSLGNLNLSDLDILSKHFSKIENVTSK